MGDQSKFSTDQEERIAQTLKRIRHGLNREDTILFEEPIHLFKPEAINAKDE